MATFMGGLTRVSTAELREGKGREGRGGEGREGRGGEGRGGRGGEEDREEGEGIVRAGGGGGWVEFEYGRRRVAVSKRQERGRKRRGEE